LTLWENQRQVCKKNPRFNDCLMVKFSILKDLCFWLNILFSLSVHGFLRFPTTQKFSRMKYQIELECFANVLTVAYMVTWIKRMASLWRVLNNKTVFLNFMPLGSNKWTNVKNKGKCSNYTRSRFQAKYYKAFYCLENLYQITALKMKNFFNKAWDWYLDFI